jgi:hypothetical protein
VYPGAHLAQTPDWQLQPAVDAVHRAPPVPTSVVTSQKFPKIPGAHAHSPPVPDGVYTNDEAGSAAVPDARYPDATAWAFDLVAHRAAVGAVGGWTHALPRQTDPTGHVF